MTDRIDKVYGLFKTSYGYGPREDTIKRIESMSEQEYEGFVACLQEDLGKAIEEDEIYDAENLEDYNTRIVGMMMDYGISMSDAILWDFETFQRSIKEIFELGGDAYVEHEFYHYLWQNGINKPSDGKFYADMFMGRTNDLILKKD
jgi:hypothetical protein